MSNDVINIICDFAALEGHYIMHNFMVVIWLISAQR